MKLSFKYRIYANKDTISKAENWIELCRKLYNCALAERIYAYKMGNVNLHCFEQIKELPQMKKENPEYYKIDSCTLQNVIEQLDRTYNDFFRRIKKGKFGFPRFKGKTRYNSFTIKKQGWKLDKNYLRISNIGTFKIKLSRPIEGTIKTITIKKTSTGKWFACFNCDNVPEHKLPKLNNIVGIDIGIEAFLTDSEGNKVENPRLLKHTLKRLRVIQRKLTRSNNGSNRRKRTKYRVARYYEDIVNQRKDFHHKLANIYINNYDIIVIESLIISNMVQNNRLARDINDCAWGKFFGILKYKAEEAGREVIQINPCNTSKTCSECGTVNQEIKLNDRKWLCKNCGTYHDRDFNAAKNIKRVGQTQQELTYDTSQSVSCESTSVECQGNDGCFSSSEVFTIGT